MQDKIALIKDPVALEAAMVATDLTQQQIITMANNGMVSSAKAVDEALEFDTDVYLVKCRTFVVDIGS